MCNQCKDVPANFDTSYGSDPVATDARVDTRPRNRRTSVRMTDLARAVEKVTATIADPAGLVRTVRLSDAFNPDNFVGITAQGRGFRATADDMTDADVLPSTKDKGNYNPNHGTAVANALDTTGGFPTELEADIHESATVENTNTLISDLEQQLDDAKADLIEKNNRLQNQAETIMGMFDVQDRLKDKLESVRTELDRVSKLKSGVYDNASRFLKERDSARRGLLVMARAFRAASRLLSVAEAQRDTMRSDNVKLVAEYEDLRDYSRGIFNKLSLMTLSRNAIHEQTVNLNNENERLRATIDFLKRPFYERWAISLKVRMMSFAG
jgi:hypothetical protein